MSTTVAGQPEEGTAMMERQTLIERYIELPAGRPADRAYLRESQVDVWALVMYYQSVAGRDVSVVARDYRVPVEAVDAALAFYAAHQDLMDARMKINRAYAA